MKKLCLTITFLSSLFAVGCDSRGPADRIVASSSTGELDDRFDHWLFVANFNSGSVSVLAYDPKAVDAQPVETFLVGKQPVALGHDGRFLFVGNWGDHSITVHAVRRSGRVKSLHRVEMGDLKQPHDILIRNDVLVVGHESNPGFVSSWRIHPDGSLTPIARLQLGNMVPWIRFSQDKNTIYATSRKTNEVFSIALADQGELALTGRVQLAPETEPYSIVPHPSRPVAVVALYNSSQVLTLELSDDGAVGSMPAQTLNLPDGTYPRSLALDPERARLFLASSAHQAILEVGLDGQDQLTFRQSHPMRLNPRHVEPVPGAVFLISLQDGVRLFSPERPGGDMIATGSLTHWTMATRR